MSIAWSPPSNLRSRAPIEVWNALVSRFGEPAALAGKGVSAIFDLDSRPPDSCVSALVQAGELQAVIAFKSFPFAALFGSELTIAELGCLPEALRNVLVEGMLSSLWSAIPQNELPTFSVLKVGGCGETAAAIEPVEWLAATIRGLAAQPVQVLIGCDATAAVSAILGGGLASRAVWTGLREALKMAAFYTLGAIELSVHGLRRLAPGAVIVLPEIRAGARLLRIDHEIHEFRTDEKGWIYSGVRSLFPEKREQKIEIGVEMSDAAADDQDQPQPSSLSDLVLRIDLDLGSTGISLAAIEAWKVGALVELDPPEPNDGVEVTLRVNGQALAVGDLIRIDERLAVRINKLLLAS